jgi:hypothetical protein
MENQPTSAASLILLLLLLRCQNNGSCRRPISTISFGMSVGAGFGLWIGASDRPSGFLLLLLHALLLQEAREVETKRFN